MKISSIDNVHLTSVLYEFPIILNLRSAVDDVLQKLGFAGQLLAKVHDNARNITKAMKNDDVSFEEDSKENLDEER